MLKRGDQQCGGVMAQGESHLVPLRSAGARVPLFCVHSGGGDALQYRDMAAAMRADQPVYGFSPPELRGINPFPTVEGLASIYLRDLRKIQGHGPYQLCGQSFGGLVAYEMAMQLLSEGEAVRLLALFDTLHPAYRQNLSTDKLVKFHLTYFADRVRKYGSNLLRGRIDRVAADLRRFARGRITRLAWEATRMVARATDRPMPEMMNSNALLFSAAWRNYNPKIYKGKLVLFRSETRTPEYGDDLSLGWELCAPDGIEVHIVPGSHITMMQLPHVNGLVDKLTPHLGDVVSHELAG
jgi:thioesterase domain-containing protein